MLASIDRCFARHPQPISYRLAYRQYDKIRGCEVRILTPTSVRRKPERHTEQQTKAKVIPFAGTHGSAVKLPTNNHAVRPR